MAETFMTKLGTTTKAGERSRIWLEGKRLTAHGFTVGALYRRNWNVEEGKLTLRVIDKAHFDQLPRDEKGTVSGKGDKPIIDIVGAKVREVFGATSDHVTVTFRADHITITRIA
jgi:hypothetical protein